MNQSIFSQLSREAGMDTCMGVVGWSTGASKNVSQDGLEQNKRTRLQLAYVDHVARQRVGY